MSPGLPVVSSLAARLEAGGYATETVAFEGRPALVGRASHFRLRWMAVRLHTFVVASTFGDEVGPEELDHFLRLSSRYAVAHKGGLPRGLQTAVAAVAVALVDRPSVKVVQWAERPHGRSFGAIAYPVVADLSTGRVTHPGRMVLGAVFNGHLRAIAEEIVSPAIA